MKRKILLIPLALLLAVSLVAIGCAAPAPAPPAPAPPAPAPPAPAPPTPAPEVEVIKWRLQVHWPVGFALYYGPREVGKYITEMSGGRLTVEVFPAGSIVPALEEMMATHEGLLDAAVQTPHKHTGKLGLAADAFTLYPAGLSPLEFLTWVYEGGGLELWQEMYDRKGINVHEVGPTGISSAELFGWYSKPMLSLGDFKGLKFRTAGIWGEMLTEMGAAVTHIPGGEVYTSMERGVIDAFEYSTPAVDYSAGFHELGAYVHGPGIHAPMCAFDLLVNKDTWNALPDDLKAIVTHAAEATTLRTLAFLDYGDIGAIEKLKAYGTQFVSLPEDVQREVVKVANEYYDMKAAEDPFFAKVLESQRDFAKRYRAYKAFTQPDPDLMAYEK